MSQPDLDASTASRTTAPPARRLVDGSLRRQLPQLLVLQLLAVAALAALVWHAHQGDRLDTSVASAVYARPGTMLRTVAKMVSTLATPGAVVIASIAVGAWAWRRARDHALAAFCPVAVVLTSLLGHALKLVVERARPATALLAHETDYSFPSGHATGATALALATVLLVAAVAPPTGRRATVALVAYAAVICASRLALGVHYLTDIVGAVLFASAGVLAIGAAWHRTPADDAV